MSCKSQCRVSHMPTAVMFWFKLLPLVAALVLGVFGLVLMSHLATTYSAMGEIILATSAMSSHARDTTASTMLMLTKADEERLTPVELDKVLLLEHDLAQKAHVPINKQYRMDYLAYMRQRAGLVDDLEQGIIDSGLSPPQETESE